MRVLKLLFKFPCRGREKLFFESLDSLNRNIRDVNNYHISITIDTDDGILNTPEVVEKINTYPNTSIGWGLSKSKVDAINRNFPDYDYDVVICWSNDMFMSMYGADDIMRDYIMQIGNNRNDMDFLIHFPEPDSREYLNVLYVATRKYYERFGYIYHSSYLSLWCDNESKLVSEILGRYHFVGVPSLYEHKNPAYHHYGMERDVLFNEQQGHWEQDEKNFHERKSRNFDLHLIENK